MIDISVDSKIHFNPLDYVYDPATKIPSHTAKAEFILLTTKSGEMENE